MQRLYTLARHAQHKQNSTKHELGEQKITGDQNMQSQIRVKLQIINQT